MNEIPLHPLLVHLPVGLAIIMPAVFFGFHRFIKRGKLKSGTYVMPVLLQSILVASCLIAIRTGEQEEERIEKAEISVPHEAIESHEELARIMTGVAVSALILSAASLKRSRFTSSLQIGSVVVSLAVAALAFSTAHRGGELVFVYGAAGQGPFYNHTSNEELKTDETRTGESDH